MSLRDAGLVFVEPTVYGKTTGDVSVSDQTDPLA